jgi:hypothetical protein
VILRSLPLSTFMLVLLPILVLMSPARLDASAVDGAVEIINQNLLEAAESVAEGSYGEAKAGGATGDGARGFVPHDPAPETPSS